jgi:hypothetical protein
MARELKTDPASRLADRPSRALLLRDNLIARGVQIPEARAPTGDAADLARSLINGGVFADRTMALALGADGAGLGRLFAGLLHFGGDRHSHPQRYHNTSFATFSTEASRRNAGSDRGANDGRGS